jgi:DNA adenine methylase
VRLAGSKGAAGVAERIITAMPAHDFYLEAFAGSAIVGRRKRPAALELYCDRDPARASLLRVMLETSRLVICGDVLEVIRPEALPPSALIYADPPYLFEARRAAHRRYYRHEFGTIAEHARLLDWLERARCAVLLSGYGTELYADRLAHWWRTDYRTRTRGATVTECLWSNFAPGSRPMHDVRYVGKGFRERERIKRKVHRWRRRFEQLPADELAAVLAALSDAGLHRRMCRCDIASSESASSADETGPLADSSEDAGT